MGHEPLPSEESPICGNSTGLNSVKRVRGPWPDGKLGVFMKSVQAIAPGRNGDPVYYPCDFDDPEALVKSFIWIASEVLEARKGDDVFSPLLNDVLGEDELEKQPCCACSCRFHTGCAVM